MALKGMNTDLIRFTKKTGDSGSGRPVSQPVKKVFNFFDDDDDDDEFETFANDRDFAKMKVSMGTNDGELFDRNDDEKLGKPWGGKDYSLREEKQDPFHSVATGSSSKSSIQSSSEPDQFQPFQLRDQITANSSAAATQVIKTRSHVSKNGLETTKSSSFDTHVQTRTSSIENVVQNSKSEMSNAERNRLQAEVKDLRKTVLSLQQQHKKTPIPVETVKKLMLNQPCVLEVFKALDGKLALLDEAIKMGDGNALITILLFIKKTVKYSIFAREIAKRPVAVKHIVSFMKAHYDYDELIKLLRHLGRKEEAMMLEYKKALSISNPDAQLQAIDSCQRSYESAPELADAVSVLKEHESLLKRQIQIEVKDKRTQAEGRDQVMRLHPRTQLVSSPLISTLHYCCFYHYGKTEPVLNPLALQKDFKLTDKQFEWVAVGARAELKKWNDLESLFSAKNWFGSNKQKSSLGFDKVISLLQKKNAPPDILAKYLTMVESPETRLSLATSLQIHQVAVETIVSMKDKQKLEDYRKHLDRTHPVHATISSYLNNSQIKWK